ncbi:catalase-peroxidase, partial [Vibrio parahaemolyticus V-223/04]
ALVFA